MGNKDKKIYESDKEGIKKVRNLAGCNKAAALGLAVCLALNVTAVGCHRNVEEEDEDDYIYLNGGYGGSYYYSGGSSFRTGTWAKTTSKISGTSSTKGYTGSSTSKGYAAARGGSIGG